MDYKKRTYTYVTVSLLILVAGFSMLLLNSFRLTNLRKKILQNEQLMGDIRGLNVNLLQAESAMRGYYLVNNEWYLNNYHVSIEKYEAQMRKLEKDVGETRFPRQLLGDMKSAAQNRIDRLNKGMAVFRKEGLNGGLTFVNDGQGKVLMDKFRNISAVLEQQVNAETRQLGSRIETMARWNRISTLGIGLMAAGLVVFLAMYFLKTEKKIAGINRQLVQKNHELDQFARVTSHDLQEPLRMIHSFLKLLEKKYGGQLDEQAKQYIFRVTDGAERMQKLIVNLLAYARTEKAELQFERIAIESILKEVEKDLESRIRETGALIRYEQLPDVWGDATQLFRLFLNLIGNSIKFSQKNSRPEIIISGENRGGYAELSISDNGIGIPEKYRHQIFAPFTRLHNAADYPGTGLGLATCKKIVSLHGGSIQVASEENKGTVFTILLPAPPEN